jgi:ribosome-associated protein
LNERIDSIEEIRGWVVATLDDMKAEKVVALDVRGRTAITDLMVFASGNSRRHVKSIADHVQERARADGRSVLGVEGAESAEWILIDLADAVVHVMSHEVREFYRLENIWGVDDADQESLAEDELLPRRTRRRGG